MWGKIFNTDLNKITCKKIYIYLMYFTDDLITKSLKTTIKQPIITFTYFQTEFLLFRKLFLLAS